MRTRNPVNLRRLSIGDREIGTIVDKIPDFKNILISDVDELVYMNKSENGKQVIVIFDFDEWLYQINNQRRRY